MLWFGGFTSIFLQQIPVNVFILVCLGPILHRSTILNNWKHFKIIPSIGGSISAKQTLTLTILFFPSYWLFSSVVSFVKVLWENIFRGNKYVRIYLDLRDRAYLRWQREIILGHVMYDTIYSTETVLAKIRGGLKDTEVNVRLRPGCTII